MEKEKETTLFKRTKDKVNAMHKQFFFHLTVDFANIFLFLSLKKISKYLYSTILQISKNRIVFKFVRQYKDIHGKGKGSVGTCLNIDKRVE